MEDLKDLHARNEAAERAMLRAAIERDEAHMRHLMESQREEAELAALEAAVMAQRKEGLARLLANMTAANERQRAEYEREQERK